MRSALICVFFAIIIRNDECVAENNEDFKPTPIPLDDWPSEKRETAGTLQETIKTDAPPSVVAVPAHYWEDALRHSVYLTLVRDKIDQLIAKEAIISPDSKPDNNLSKEIDDHDLWEKIKTARFDRLKEEPIPPGDITILARGRLLEEKDGFRFAEDDTIRNNCSDSNCTKGVKAYWSVKRVRQGEMSPGEYHYELTFAVTSQTNRKLKKPYENPARTFTIKENSPNERPQARNNEQVHHVERRQRAIWVHKNIGKRPTYTRSLDRIFSSLFSDEDSHEEPPYRSKQKTYVPQMYPQHAKVGHVDDREPYHHKKVVSYSMPKPQSFRYNHPPLPPPPFSYVQYPYLNMDPLENSPYVPTYSDNRYVPSNIVKTTRPAVLPTPITNYPLLKESTIETPFKTKLNATEYTTKEPEVVTSYKIYNHLKQSPMKVNYFPDHIRPPVYNAPPGVFVTMDKKPFKPMPPLKYIHSNKPQKAIPPDFRPSPQVLDTQFSEPSSIADTAFRPITTNYTEGSNTKEDSNKTGNKVIRKPNTSRKPPKKQENIKSTRPSTTIPEIITPHTGSVEEDSSMEWANLLGAFTKTTPMVSHRDKSSTDNTQPTTTTPTPTTTEDSFEDIEVSSEAVSKSTSTTTTTTTPKPKKRTRPPPKFTKQEKVKKHKRVTSTTTTTTTVKPTQKYPTKIPSDDLMPQASSAATSGVNSVRETKSPKAPVTTTTNSITPRPTTTTKITISSSTTSTSSTAVDSEQPVVTTQPKSKNRFRQSTLMQKGTSVNHDKWSATTLEKNRTNSIITNNLPLRRKASKFQGYIPSSTPRSPEPERNREDHKDHAYNFYTKSNNSTTEQSEHISIKTSQPTQPTVENQETINESTTEWDRRDETVEGNEDKADDRESENDVQEYKDNNEYIFPTASTLQEVKQDYKITDKESKTTEIAVVTSPHSIAKNKTKCKKKKHNNLTTTEAAIKLSSEAETTTNIITPSSTTTTQAVTTDIFEELFGGFTMDDATENPSNQATEPSESESETHERYVPTDDDLEDFLHSLDQTSNYHAGDDKLDEKDEEVEEDEEYDDERDNEDSPFNIDEENSDRRNLNEDYYDETQENQDQPFSLLELMAME